MTTAIINVRDLGARGDDRHADGPAIQAALDRAAGTGATVLIPPGRYRCGTLVIRSDTTVELTGGAVLVGPETRDGFIPVPYRDPLHEWDRDDKWHFIVILDAERVILRGAGTIDGRGWAWCRPGAEPESWCIAHDPRPSVMVAAIRSRKVVIEGITLTDPPNWHLDLYHCDDVVVRGLTIASDHRLPNNDGIDISGSSDVRISDCRIDCGDDGIVINGRGRETRRVCVTNCVISSHCAALKVGWEFTRFDISQIAFSNCILTGCNRGLAAYSCNGAVVEDIAVSNLVIDTNAPVFFSRPIHLDLRRGRDTGAFGAIRRVRVAGLTARTQGRILMTSEAGGHLQDIRLRDVSLDYAYLEDPDPVAEANASNQFSNANRAARRARAAMVAEHVRGLEVDGLTVAWPDGPVPAAWRIPVKRENGGARLFRPDYATAAAAAFAALWARDVHGRWRAPGVAASAPGLAAIDADAASAISAG